MKTEVFNLIVLDESGSMCDVARQTIDGCNETINTIRSSQDEHADTLNHHVSIFAFQGSGQRPSRYILKDVSAADVRYITPDDYKPWGNTPLYDAVGGTLADLRARCAGHKLAVGNVTIITDGMENSSTRYNRTQVARMIEALKEEGWTFSFIGANIDVKATAEGLGIENHMEFCNDAEGTKAMFARESTARNRWTKAMAIDLECPAQAFASEEEEIKYKKAKMRGCSKNYFD